MQQPIEPPKKPPYPFNDDAEIITRLDECERMKGECPNKDCPYVQMIIERQQELKRALVDHWLI